MRRVALRTACALLVAVMGVRIAGQSSSRNAAIPRMPDGKPDFSGFWSLPYVPNMAASKEAEAAVPYTPEGLRAYRNHDAKDDPTSLCLYPGVPRIMQSPYPMQIVQTPDRLVMLFEYMKVWRAIPIDGRTHRKGVEPTFMGESVGSWDGDTLVIDTIGLNDRTWLDTAGHQHSDAMHVIERLRRTADAIMLDFTVDDPKMYSRPWKHERIIGPLPPIPGLPELIEYACNENNRDLPHLVSTKPAAER
jgi:hypothetical protein